VILACGAFTNALLLTPINLMTRDRVILLVEIRERLLPRFSDLPSLIVKDLDGKTALRSVYSLPPITYPDGKVYYKISGDFEGTTGFRDVDEAKE
tara:strand:+ start:507 stop:791 length:285 start_codon:yes stop_codon:yes gene_type:complete